MEGEPAAAYALRWRIILEPNDEPDEPDEKAKP
jgi:hypothetical protein